MTPHASPGGFPVDGAPLGKVAVSADAHTGARSLRLVRTAADKPASETGLNRARLIEPLRGAMDFRYKAVSADSAAFRFYVIPTGADGIENTGSPRAVFTAPGSCVGDAAAKDVRVSIALAAGLAAAPAEVRLGDLATDARKPAEWTVHGERKVVLTARAGADPAAEPASASWDLVPRMVLRGFGPTATSACHE